jgi:hypothetical protein
LAAPALVTYGWLQLRRAVVKKEVKHWMIAGMDKESLVLLKFSEQEARSTLRWEHAGEFEFNGNMYDVVETRQLGDTLYYYCWWDHAETQLNRQLEALVSGVFNTDPQQSERRQQLSDFYQSMFHSAPFIWRISAFLALVGSDFPLFNTCPLAVFFCPPTPPPELG